jgi:glucose-1-phosphate thymidylyltransferase
VIGIVLAGGTGSRLWPITASVSKQMLPIYDKPMIHYPISTLMAAGIKDIVVVTTERDSNAFQGLLGDGHKLGVNFFYEIQDAPRGIADAFNVCKSRIQGQKVALILGDNLFHGQGLGRNLQKYLKIEGAQIFGYQVSDPSQYGVAALDKHGNILQLVEKPSTLVSNIAIPGLYFYDETILDVVANVKPSQRNELEITDVNLSYLANGKLKIEVLPRGTAWLDTGTVDSLIEASNYMQIVEKRQGAKVACLEEVALNMGYINLEDFEKCITDYADTPYATYLKDLRNQFLDREAK